MIIQNTSTCSTLEMMFISSSLYVDHQNIRNVADSEKTESVYPLAKCRFSQHS